MLPRYTNICMMPAALYLHLLHHIPTTLAVCVPCSRTPLAIQPAMDASPTPRPGVLLMDMFFKLNGPGIPGETYDTVPTKAYMGAFTPGELPCHDVHEVNQFMLSEFRAFAARFVSPMPQAWIAVAGNSGHGYVFDSDDEDGWFRALALIAQARLATSLSEDDGLDPFITFVPFQQDQPAGVTKCTLNIEDLSTETKAYIDARVPDDSDYDCMLRMDIPLPETDDDL